MSETLRKDLPADYVRYFSFAASEFEAEELSDCAARLAEAEGRTEEDVEKEFADKLRYVQGEDPYPFETWGPQELANRLNASQEGA
jgi:hypothetical protein